MKSVYFYLAVVIAVCTAFLFAGDYVFANVDRPNLNEQVKGHLNSGAENSGLKIKDQEAPDVRVFGSTMINTLLGAYGIAFTVLMVRAGALLVTAKGNQDKIDSAYKIIVGAVTGLILVLSAYSIAYFVGKSATRATRYGTETINTYYE